jgi:hypothetical protein
MWSLLKRASAFVPLAISGLLLVLILLYLARMGGARQPDEGAEAHLFQLLMPLQVLIIAFFAWKWLPRNPKAARQILAMQISAVVMLLALVRALHL